MARKSSFTIRAQKHVQYTRCKRRSRRRERGERRRRRRMCGGTACMQSSNVMEDISCRTADLEELIYPRQTEIKLFVRKDIIDILRGSEHKTSLSPSRFLSPLWPEKRNRFTRYSNEPIYCLFFFSKINLASRLFLSFPLSPADRRSF